MEISVDIDQFNQEVIAIQRNFAEQLPKILQGAALTTFAKIRKRIQETGTSETGSSYPGYSENELPTFFFENKATNSSGSNAIKNAKEENRGLSYKEFKAANNGADSVKVRNLTFTGDMWRSIGLTGIEQQKAGLTVIIEPKTGFAKEKAKFNADMIGDFLSVSAKEDQEATADFQAEIDSFLNTQQ